MEIFTAAGISALFQVIAIDLALAGDNAIVIGLAAAGLPAAQRKRAIMVGIAAATVLRIFFALITQWLLTIGPMMLIAGGLLLLWVCLMLWRVLRVSNDEERDATEALSNGDFDKDCVVGGKGSGKTFSQDVRLKLDSRTDPSNLRLIAFIQQPGQRQVLGAAQQQAQK